MTLLLRLYRFIGSLSFTLILLSCVICVVAIGTILESITQSHRYAEQWTYGHPFFFVVFLSLFANILFSATRRWPFKKRHIPFLMTHLGLLLLLTGVWIKGGYGLQGHMNLLEGSGSHQVLFSNQHLIRLSDRSGGIYEWNIVHPFFGSSYTTPVNRDNHNKPHLKQPITPQMELLAFQPHGKEQLQLWHQKGKFAPLGIEPITPHQERLHPIGSTPWLFRFAGYGDLVEQISTLYPKEAELSIYRGDDSTPLYVVSLADALKSPVCFPNGCLHLKLEPSKEDNTFTESGSSTDWQLHCRWSDQTGRVLGESLYPLDGARRLQEEWQTALWPAQGAPYRIGIERTPSVTLVVDDNDTEWLLVLGPFGSLQSLPFSNQLLESVYAIDRGFGGYLVQASLPLCGPDHSPYACHMQHLKRVTLAMQHAVQENPSQGVPEKLFQKACEEEGVDFSTQWIAFLDAWKQSQQWLYLPNPNNAIQQRLFAKLDWNQLPAFQLRAMQWAWMLMQELQTAFIAGKDLTGYLQEIQWPISIKEKTAEAVFYALQDQLFAAAFALPPPPLLASADSLKEPTTGAAFLSLLLRQRKDPWIALSLPSDAESSLTPPPTNSSLYCRLLPCRESLPPLAQKESESPWLRCRVRLGDMQEDIELVYDATGKQLAHPVLGGNYLIESLPYAKEIPYHVRLRDARKIVYPHSDQAVSYEAESVIIDRTTGEEEEVRLSMNRVHETKDGHRFYLSSLAPGDETAVRQVRLVVNRDPLRSLFTYLGALLVATGTLLLLFRRSP